VLFASCFAYAFGKQHATDDVNEAVARELERGHTSSVAGFRTLFCMRPLDERLLLHTDCSTLITRARCRAAGAFLRSGAENWLTVDDDVDASTDALARLRELAVERVVTIAAMRLRKGRAWNVWTFDDADVDAMPWGVPFPVRHAGLALACFPRRALNDVARAFPDLTWSERPANLPNPGVFVERIAGGEWYGEDVAFCERARRAGVHVMAVKLEGIAHAGIPNVVGSPHE